MTPTPTTYTYKTVGNCDIKADVYLPSAGAAGRPLIVYIHGGALINGSRRGINPRQLDLYLSAGYGLASIDYRLAPETKLPGIIEDLKDAFRWVGSSGLAPAFGSSHRTVAIGHSAGGYLALMSGFCVEPRPEAVVSFYGYGDIAGDWYGKPDPFYCSQPIVTEEASGRLEIGPVISEPYEGRGKERFYLYCRQQGCWPQEVAGHDPHEERSFFKPYCPVQNISSSYPPTLLLHGDRDTDVPYEQSALMSEELARHQVQHELVTMAGRGHGFDRETDDPLVRESFQKVLAFLNSHTA
jgi:acetyl esterase/lipase